MLSEILRSDDVRPGDRVVTSGLGGIYPPGIPIGVVTRLFAKEGVPHRFADVVPYADFARLEVLEILLRAEARNPAGHSGASLAASAARAGGGEREGSPASGRRRALAPGCAQRRSASRRGVRTMSLSLEPEGRLRRVGRWGRRKWGPAYRVHSHRGADAVRHRSGHRLATGLAPGSRRPHGHVLRSGGRAFAGADGGDRRGLSGRSLLRSVSRPLARFDGAHLWRAPSVRGSGGRELAQPWWRS